MRNLLNDLKDWFEDVPTKVKIAGVALLVLVICFAIGTALV